MTTTTTTTSSSFLQTYEVGVRSEFYDETPKSREEIAQHLDVLVHSLLGLANESILALLHSKHQLVEVMVNHHCSQLVRHNESVGFCVRLINLFVCH